MSRGWGQGPTCRCRTAVLDSYTTLLSRLEAVVRRGQRPLHLLRIAARLSLVLLLAACEDDPRAGAASGERTGDVPRYQGSIVQEIGRTEGEEPYLLGSVGGIARDSSGRIFVADLQATTSGCSPPMEHCCTGSAGRARDPAT